jgi:hypothetical protein
MNILKTSMILYPSLPAPKEKKIADKRLINSEPLTPAYDFPKWVIKAAPYAIVLLGGLLSAWFFKLLKIWFLK